MCQRVEKSVGGCHGYTCVPSFTSMCTVLSKFKEGRSNLKKIASGYFLLVVVMETISYGQLVNMSVTCKAKAREQQNLTQGDSLATFHT